MNKEMILEALNSRYRCLKEPSADPHQAYDRRFLTSLRVYGTREDDEPQSPQTLGQHIIDQQILKKKVTASISELSFRDPQVLVQFWSPVTVRNRCWLALDQPFGIGVVNEALYKYRLECEQRMFAVDGEHIEELGGSPGRVYRQKLPEWSLDIQGLPTSQNIKDSTACHNIHGYLSLPVLEPASGCCVGVLELITLSKHVDYAFEVKEISKALKEQDLKTSNAFEEPSFCELPSEDRKIQIAKINDILKVMCDTHNLPLAQTWELSPLSSHVSHEKSIQKSCSSFNSRCIGKVCMSTAGLPFYVRDQSMWEFHEACMKQHLEKSRGVVGRALLSHCSSYCENVTKLSEEDYPLVYNACKSGLGGCFAIFVRGVEGKNDYILEFFMPLDIMDGIDSYVLNLVQKLKLKIEDASGFEMGDISSIEVIRPPSVVNNISSMTEVDTSNGIIPHPFVTKMSMQKTRGKGNDAGEPSNHLIRNIKRKRDSLTMEAVEKQAGKPMDEASKNLGVSRSTLKRFMRDHGIPRWQTSKLSDRSACVTDTIQLYQVLKVIKISAFRLEDLGSLECLSYISLETCSLKRLKNLQIMVHQDGSLVFENTTNTEQATNNVDPLMARTAMAHLNDPVVFNNTTYMEQATNNVNPLMPRTAMAHKNDPVVFNNTTYMEQATNNIDPHMDVDLDKVSDLNCVDAFPRLSGADFLDDQGTSLKMAGCSSGSVHDYLMEPDGIENAMVEIGMALEGAWPPPIGSDDMYSFRANPSDSDFSNLAFDDQLF